MRNFHVERVETEADVREGKEKTASAGAQFSPGPKIVEELHASNGSPYHRHQDDSVKEDRNAQEPGQIWNQHEKGYGRISSSQYIGNPKDNLKTITFLKSPLLALFFPS